MKLHEIDHIGASRKDDGSTLYHCSFCGAQDRDIAAIKDHIESGICQKRDWSFCPKHQAPYPQCPCPTKDGETYTAKW